jgi:hypothetical protein
MIAVMNHRCRPRRATMSEAMSQVIERASVDAAFRADLASAPERALADYPLTDDEREALLRDPVSALAATRLDTRMTQHHHDHLGPSIPGDVDPYGPWG